jgi:hypothetical protein
VDQERFDRLAVAMARGANRRTLLHLARGSLAALLAGLALGDETTDAAKRRTRHGKGRAAPQRPAAAAKRCAQQCRKKQSKAARRRCRKRCTLPIPECTSSTDCPAGELCESGVCIPSAEQCATTADCDVCERCDAGVCVTRCQASERCQNDQCVAPPQCTADGQCGACERCTGGRCSTRCQPHERCQHGQCVVAGGGGGCRPTTCAAQDAACGTIADGCRGTLDCGSCGGTTPLCEANVCVACSGDHPCPNGGCCQSDGACLANGAACDDGDPCTTGERCQNGSCGGGTTRCTTPPPCRTALGATCTPAGTCSYPPLAAGTACASVACGTCDGNGTCVGCTPPDTCGGTPGTCICAPKTCAQLEVQCGPANDGCGAVIDCGGCPSGETCLDGTCRNAQGTCAVGQSRCLAGAGNTCNGSAFCACDITVDGATVCRRSGTCGDCRSNADCGPNRVCISCPGCGGLLGTSCNELC